jgi:alpha-aminoadipate carrier protein LysW
MAESELACPECMADIELPVSPMAGEVIPCPECGIEWELVAGDPWTLTKAPEEEEDWGE